MIAKKILEMGAHAVFVGGAISRPPEIAEDNLSPFGNILEISSSFFQDISKITTESQDFTCFGKILEKSSRYFQIISNLDEKGD